MTIGADVITVGLDPDALPAAVEACGGHPAEVARALPLARELELGTGGGGVGAMTIGGGVGRRGLANCCVHCLAVWSC